MKTCPESEPDIASRVSGLSRMSRPPRIAWAPLPISLLAVIGLWFQNIQAPYESPELLIALNLLLTSLPGAGIAFLFARAFLMTGAPWLALLGCGAVLWSASGLSTLIAFATPSFDVNTIVTIQNFAVWGCVALLSGWWRASAPWHTCPGSAPATAACGLRSGAGGCGFPGLHDSSGVDATFLRARQRSQP